jgi:2-iminobutanoate/2-iminopropanoate deaminase
MDSRDEPKGRRKKSSNERPVFFGAALPFPISLAVRAGDFVMTATLGGHFFQPDAVTFHENGTVVDDGSGHGDETIEEQTRGTMRNIEAALRSAGCELTDVIDMMVWLRDPRDFRAFNAVYGEYFSINKPTRTVLRSEFMFDCRIEMKATAFKWREKN